MISTSVSTLRTLMWTLKVNFLPRNASICSLQRAERLSGSFQVQEFVLNARVPVLKLWDAKRQISCDLCVGGVNALLNTALLKFYGQVDPRVRPLVFAIKYWAKQRGINYSVNGTPSSYGESFEISENLFVYNVSLTEVCLFPSPGYTLLLIFYLQSHYAKMQLPAVHSSFSRPSVAHEGLRAAASFAVIPKDGISFYVWKNETELSRSAPCRLFRLLCAPF
ncbi:hypothetical protein PsorP6_005299 [Peronosclerospora sorghi]|uniref:Uncharacterized protein n=1 Tax=Peronosclerospora sorghi TaxID=230839 RepID=A0ACC0W453_9STRA|nr:hypothetical protein PsorP6_005299 [Peronosclerospora sorghi]